MSKIRNIVEAAKANKVNIIKGGAVVVGTTIGLIVGLDLIENVRSNDENDLVDLEATEPVLDFELHPEDLPKD